MVLLPLVWPLPLSLATTKGISVDVFSSPYLDVSVQAVPPVYLWIQYTVTGLLPAGFPHSGTHGSRPAFGSPWLFADCCALHRLPVPRHPPCALLSLTKNSFPLLSSVPCRSCLRLTNHARITSRVLQNYSSCRNSHCGLTLLLYTFSLSRFLYSVLKVQESFFY